MTRIIPKHCKGCIFSGLVKDKNGVEHDDCAYMFGDIEWCIANNLKNNKKIK